ncbi:putative sporulation protein YtxC [Orenia marismortui]|uniref:Putative sporulation protein YtxC n=1 Tax=Orenia marismortui TaxID=46469 RepID=A0A4R8GSX2_9FIRM|nr:putative sporulation protein YtxC [Orenia marismortui]TDX49070.1 putative sporulation protein YtxC [Orenia marismortui]
MPIIQIGTNHYEEYLRDRLFFELAFLKQDGIIIEIDEFQKGDLTVFDCQLRLDKDGLDNLDFIFNEYIANALSDVIINNIEGELLEKILKSKYKQFSNLENREIIEMATDRLNFLISQEDQSIISKIQRKNRILLEILDYLEVRNEMSLEGFVQFRLKDYLSELEVSIDRAVDDFIVEKEYEEFIHLLKYFIDTQETKNELIHVVKFKNDHFKLLNEDGMVIENTYLDENLLSMVDCDLDYDDLLISALITAAPELIILHFKEPVSIIKPLKNIFADKISICLGCEYCNLNNLNELD